MTITKTNLAQFTGTTAYHVINPLSRVKYTDGMVYVAKHAGAYWLCDAISSHLIGNPVFVPKRDATGCINVKAPFAVFKFVTRLKSDGRKKTESSVFELVAEDGDYSKILSQEIAYTDFPDTLLPFECFASWDGAQWIVMLPSEY